MQNTYSQRISLQGHARLKPKARPQRPLALEIIHWIATVENKSMMDCQGHCFLTCAGSKQAKCLTNILETAQQK